MLLEFTPQPSLGNRMHDQAAAGRHGRSVTVDPKKPNIEYLKA
jgi:hypothetical protein